MGAESVEDKFRRRNELISGVQRGNIAPEEAEAEAAASGWEPFAQQPRLPAYDPMLESRWTIAMAVAWVAWRDIGLVREQHAEFRSQCTHWFFREWSEPVENGTAFAKREGWFLETWSPPTTVRLSLVETHSSQQNAHPSTRQMPPAQAEECLWRALADGHLVAEALNADSRPTEIPAREWSYLKLFEESSRDVVKYEALNRSVAFSNIKLKRADLLRLWPAVVAAPAPAGFVEPYMLEPMSRSGTHGYVPLCSALYWVITRGGARPAALDDMTSWDTGVGELLPLLCSGEIPVVGVACVGSLSTELLGQSLAAIRILPPLHGKIEDVLVAASSYIACSFYADKATWESGLNDKLYERGRPFPTWTHLQANKEGMLKWWPRPTTKAKPEHDCRKWLIELMTQSPDRRVKPKAELRKEAKLHFSDLGNRQFQRAWEGALEESGAQGWSNAGRPKKI